MKITIILSAEEIKHIKDHTFYDECGTVEVIMKKIQRKCKQ